MLIFKLKLNEPYRNQEILQYLFFNSKSNLGLESKFFDFAVFGQDILPLGSGSVNPHIFAYPIPGSQNLEDSTNKKNPDPKHCFFKIHYYLVVY